MRSDRTRLILCWAAALALALTALLGMPALYLRLPEKLRSLPGAIYHANALQQILLMGLPALLILQARPARWRGFRESLRPVSFPTFSCCLLLAVGGTVIVSLAAALWSRLLAGWGYTEEALPLPVPGNAGEWLLLTLSVSVIPALCEEALFRGLLQTTLCKYLPRAGLLVAAALFASLHFRWSAWPGLLLVGLVLGLVFRRHGLPASALLHALYNETVLLLSSRGIGVSRMLLFFCAAACVLALRLLLPKEEPHETDDTGL